MRDARFAAFMLAATVGLWSGHRWPSIKPAGGLDTVARLVAQACRPCASGCVDSAGCEAGTDNGACGGGGNFCSSCGAGQTCAAQACCTLNTCAAAGATCGNISNNCGGTLACGNCPSGQACTNNHCVTQGFDCSTCNCGCNTAQTACFTRSCPLHEVWDDVVCACTQ